jgi:hypothetical protein
MSPRHFRSAAQSVFGFRIHQLDAEWRTGTRDAPGPAVRRKTIRLGREERVVPSLVALDAARYLDFDPPLGIPPSGGVVVDHADL